MTGYHVIPASELEAGMTILVPEHRQKKAKIEATGRIGDVIDVDYATYPKGCMFNAWDPVYVVKSRKRKS